MRGLWVRSLSMAGPDIVGEFMNAGGIQSRKDTLSDSKCPINDPLGSEGGIYQSDSSMWIVCDDIVHPYLIQVETKIRGLRQEQNGVGTKLVRAYHSTSKTYLMLRQHKRAKVIFHRWPICSMILEKHFALRP